jgi:VWFA-related protein
MHALRSAVFLPVLLGGTFLPARAQDVPTFKSGVSNVRIDAQVTRGKEVVRGLGPADFEVLDNGKPHPLLYAALDIEPIDLLLLLDVSGSMREHVSEMASVATNALRHLRRQDRVGVMVFAKTAKLRAELTDDTRRIPAAITEAANDESVGQTTATNAAIMQGVEYLDQSSTRPRRAILIVTDNLGENYKLRDETVIDALLKTNVLLVGIIVGNNVRVPLPGTQPTKDANITTPNVFWMAAETGGEAVVSAAATTAFPDLVARVRVRYSLQYLAPPAKPGEFRKVEVNVTPAIRLKYPGVKVLARRGYYVRE